MAYQVSGMDLPAAEFNAEEWSEVLYARTRSPRQQSKETERTQSSKAASADGTQARKTASAPSVPSEVDGTAAARLRIRPLPRLPVDDFKIVFRPSAGVNLAQYKDGDGLHSAVAEEDLMCTNLPKNIFTVSTSCADRVANYAKIRDLTLRGNKLAFHAYIAPPDGARPGIIYRAWSGESPQDMLRELRRANPLLPIVQARDMGRTSRCVLIHFMAEELPPSVKMFGILYAVFNFRPKVEACVNCRQVGHRRDVSPHLPRLWSEAPGGPPLHSGVRRLWGRPHDGRQGISRRSPSQESKTETVAAEAKVLDEVNPGAGTPGANPERADFAHIFLNCPNKPKPPWRGSEHQERWEAALRSSQPDLQLRTVGWARGVAEAQMCPAI
ncbi:hypothetical protein HPB49_001592 [Dermacentor silvarum]|uniref:Uncharacterized protein n=1 Tax=Dermacentor silvarum TaxID=543639 RepID=A0ACB8DSN8_DERSI|nr:hypothetical protein HPB49_001592 [Dermacentor silvarum]